MKINTIERSVFFSMYDKLSIILRTTSMQNESTLIVVELESIRFLVEEGIDSLGISTGMVL